MEELHEVAKEFDSHHLGGGGGTWNHWNKNKSPFTTSY